MQLPRRIPLTPDWEQLSKSERATCWQAAIKLVGNMQELNERGVQVVQAILDGRECLEWEHYPEDDVRGNASQYFYHAHTGVQRPFTEHGHFHLFVHPQEAGLRRARQGRQLAPAHLVAVSMDAQGVPSGFFITNRWVTKGSWLSVDECQRGLAHFQIKGKQGIKEINRFLKALITLYQAQIISLLQERDRIMQQLCAERDTRSVMADKQIEVLCYLPISLMDDIASLENLM